MVDLETYPSLQDGSPPADAFMPHDKFISSAGWLYNFASDNQLDFLIWRIRMLLRASFLDSEQIRQVPAGCAHRVLETRLRVSEVAYNPNYRQLCGLYLLLNRENLVLA